MYEGSQRDEIIITMGLGQNNRVSDFEKSVFEEKATLNLNGAKVSRIIFYYTQTITRNTMAETRYLINPAVSEDDLGNVELRYESNRAQPRTYLIKDLKEERLQVKILYMYRDYLKKLIRVIEYQMQHRFSSSEVDIDRILELGNSK